MCTDYCTEYHATMCVHVDREEEGDKGEAGEARTRCKWRAIWRQIETGGHDLVFLFEVARGTEALEAGSAASEE